MASSLRNPRRMKLIVQGSSLPIYQNNLLKNYTTWHHNLDGLRVAAHRLRIFIFFLLMVAMHDYSIIYFRGFSTTTQGQSTCRRHRSLIWERIWRKYRGSIIKLCSTFLERCGKLELHNSVHY